MFSATVHQNYAHIPLLSFVLCKYPERIIKHGTLCVYNNLRIKVLTIKTHDSELRGQEEAGRTQLRVSYLHVYSTAVKFVDALNNPPLKLSLSYLGLSTF